MSVFVGYCNEVTSSSLKLVRDFCAYIFAAADLLGKQKENVQELEDKELAQRMADGDDRAFEILYERYFDQIYAFTVRRVGHAQIAEDVVSKVFMKAFAARTRFTWKTSFSAWIYRIATNAITDHHRTKKPDAELNVDSHEFSKGEEASGEVERQILGTELEMVLESLNERERISITMKFYAEMDNKEIAESLGISANNAGVLLHRALKKCQKKASPKLLALLEG